MAANFKKKGGKSKAEPGKVARKSKTILRRKLERQQKKEGKKRKKNQFYLDRFAAKAGAEASQPLVKTQRKPTAAREEIHQRTQKQIQQLEKQQKEQRKGRPSILAFQIPYLKDL